MPKASGFDVFKAVQSGTGLARTPVTARLRQDAIQLAQDEDVIRAAWSYRIVPLQGQGPEGLRVDGEILPAGWLIPTRGQLTAVACAVCTLGPAVSQRVNALFAERRAALAVALDSVANEMLFEASRRVQDRIQADVLKQQLCMAGELRSGDPGLALQTQAQVLRLAQAEDIGVQVGHGGMMSPVKSTSMVLGVGTGMPPAEWSRCDHCRLRDRCGLHRHSGTDTMEFRGDAP